MLTRIRKSFYDLSIRAKFVTLLYAGVLLMFALLSVLLLKVSDQKTHEDLITTAVKSVSYTNLIVEKEQQYLLGIASYYAVTSEVQDLLNASNQGLIRNRLPDDLLLVSQSRQYVLNVAFYNIFGENVDFFSIDGSYGVIAQDPNDPSRPISQLLQEKRSYMWEYIEKGETVYLTQDNSPKICLWYVIKDAHSWMPIGVMSISLDSRKLFPVDNILNKVGDNVMILDTSDHTIFGRGQLSNTLQEEEILLLQENIDPYVPNATFPARLEGVPYLVAYSKISGTTFVSLAIVQDESFFQSRDTIFLCCIIGLVTCALMLLPLLTAIADTLTRPMNQLLASMEQFRDGNREAHVNFHYHDEIGRIGAVFNAMVRENNRLIDQTYLLTIQKQAAELAKLQAQINPHFIYNTLNTIQWAAIEKNDEEIAELVYSIGQVFRLSLSRGNDLIPVATEQELLTFYLSLQKRRYGVRIDYQLSFQDDVLSYRIPKLLIQPLVENSSVHGARDAKTPIHIDVQVEKRGARIWICVKDDGRGIPDAVLQLLPENLTEETAGSHHSGFALSNIAKRLKLYYGQDYVFQIESTCGIGTAIVIEIPLEPKEI